MSQNYLQLPLMSQKKSQPNFVGAAELFEKAWTLCFGNSTIDSDNFRQAEIEERYLILDDFTIFVKLEKNKDGSELKNIRLYDKNKRINQLFNNQDIKQNYKYVLSEDNLTSKLMNIFESKKDSLRKIKILQRKLLNEVNNYHSSFTKSNVIYVL